MDKLSQINREIHDVYVIGSTKDGIALSTGVIKGIGMTPAGETVYCMKLAHMNPDDTVIVPKDQVFPSWNEALKRWKAFRPGEQRPPSFNPRHGLN